MAQIDLSNANATKIGQACTLIRQEMLARKTIWDRLTNKQRKRWFQSGKDPILTDVLTLWNQIREGYGLDELVR